MASQKNMKYTPMADRLSNPSAINGLKNSHASAILTKLRVRPQTNATRKAARTAMPLKNAPIKGIQSSNRMMGVNMR